MCKDKKNDVKRCDVCNHVLNRKNAKNAVYNIDDSGKFLCTPCADKRRKDAAEDG